MGDLEQTIHLAAALFVVHCVGNLIVPLPPATNVDEAQRRFVS
jgi:hypothetical protein